jgi:hypothetical protein
MCGSADQNRSYTRSSSLRTHICPKASVLSGCILPSLPPIWHMCFWFIPLLLVNAGHLAQQALRSAHVRPWMVVHSQVPLQNECLAGSSAEIQRRCAWLGILSFTFLGPVSGWGALGVGIDANFITMTHEFVVLIEIQCSANSRRFVEG